MRVTGWFVVMLSLVCAQLTIAAEKKDAPLFDEKQMPADDQIEPSIVITEDKAIVIKEYRVKGQLYMIEIQPKKGRSYYLVDTDGDGSLETRRGEMSPDFLIPSWVLLKW